MRELRVRQELMRVGNGGGPPPENVTDRVTHDAARDDTRDEVTPSVTNGVTGGIQGGSAIGSTDQIRKEAEEPEDFGSPLSGRDQAGAARDDSGDGACDDMSDETALLAPSPKTSRVSSRTKRAPRKTAFPEGFVLTVEHRAYAASKGWPEWWIENRFIAFEELARSRGWVYADWKLALYGFLRRELEEYNRGPQQLAHLAPKTPARQPFLEQNDARAEARRRELAAELKGPAATSTQALLAGIGGSDA
jgi:hypothetical protein